MGVNSRFCRRTDLWCGKSLGLLDNNGSSELSIILLAVVAGSNVYASSDLHSSGSTSSNASSTYKTNIERYYLW